MIFGILSAVVNALGALTESLISLTNSIFGTTLGKLGLAITLIIAICFDTYFRDKESRRIK